MVNLRPTPGNSTSSTRIRQLHWLPGASALLTLKGCPSPVVENLLAGETPLACDFPGGLHELDRFCLHL
jgi:hypothetical protein